MKFCLKRGFGGVINWHTGLRVGKLKTIFWGEQKKSLLCFWSEKKRFGEVVLFFGWIHKDGTLNAKSKEWENFKSWHLQSEVAISEVKSEVCLRVQQNWLQKRTRYVSFSTAILLRNTIPNLKKKWDFFGFRYTFRCVVSLWFFKQLFFFLVSVNKIIQNAEGEKTNSFLDWKEVYFSVFCCNWARKWFTK